MRRTYIKTFIGTHDAVEAGIRKFDEVLKRMYNVYGGRRECSRKDADGNYEVIMSYTANWMDSDRMRFLCPEYTIEAINRRFNREADRLPIPIRDDFWCDMIKEDDGTYANRRR